MLTLQKCITTLFIWRFLFVRCFFGGYVFSIWNRIIKFFAISQAFFVDWMGVLLLVCCFFTSNCIICGWISAYDDDLFTKLIAGQNLVQWRFFYLPLSQVGTLSVIQNRTMKPFTIAEILLTWQITRKAKLSIPTMSRKKPAT